MDMQIAPGVSVADFAAATDLQAAKYSIGAAIRSTASPAYQSDLCDLGSKVKTLSDIQKENVAEHVFIECANYNGIGSAEDRTKILIDFLEPCGPFAVMSAAQSMLRQFSHRAESQDEIILAQANVSVRWCMDVTKRILLQQNVSLWAVEAQNHTSCENYGLLVLNLASMCLRLPSNIANACLSTAESYPDWACPRIFYTELIHTACCRIWRSTEAHQRSEFLHSLSNVLVEAGHCEYVAQGVLRFLSAEAKLCSKVEMFLHSVSWNARAKGQFCKTLIVAARETEWHLAACMAMLGESTEAQDAFVDFIVTAENAVENGSVKNSDPICRTVLKVLEAVSVKNQCSIFLRSCVEAQAGRVATLWSQELFALRVTRVSQLHVTNFILRCIPYLNAGDVDTGNEIILSLVEGVGNRLSSTSPQTRRDGMLVGEALGKMFGEHIVFDDRGPPEDQSQSTRGLAINRVSKRESPTEDVSHRGAVLLDEEKDLCALRKPLYLRDCLAMLRDTDDTTARSSHAAVLAYVGELVKSKPMDLSHFSASLALEILQMKNSFGVENFEAMHHSALVALITSDPEKVAQALIPETFSTENVLSTRLKVLECLNSTALEMAGFGSYAFDALCVRNNVVALPLTKTSSDPFVICRQFTNEQGRVNSSALLSNRSYHFDDIVCSLRAIRAVAPQWLYALINGIMGSCRHQELWSDSDGSRHLTGIFTLLSNVLRCAGQGPEVQTIALDTLEFAWTVHATEIRDLRFAVLCAAWASIEVANWDDMIKIATRLDMPRELMAMAKNEAQDECREMAVRIAAYFDAV